jgi:hypothetical protein
MMRRHGIFAPPSPAKGHWSMTWHIECVKPVTSHGISSYCVSGSNGQKDIRIGDMVSSFMNFYVFL